MKKLFTRIVVVAVFCVLFALPSFAGQADLCDIDDSHKFDKSSVKWLDNGREITFTYMAVAKTPQEQKQFGEYYHVGAAYRILYDIKIHRDIDDFFEIARIWLTDEAGNVIFEKTDSHDKVLVSKSPRVKRCYDMIINDYIGLSPEEAYDIANNLIDGKISNLNKAFPYLIVVAERGVDGAQVNGANYLLGLCYSRGIGTAKDATNAEYCFKKAANNRHAGACVEIGLMYLNGVSVSQSDDMAAKYFKTAAEQDNVPGLKNLAFCYMNGRGVSQSQNKALEYMKRAADLGDSEAKNYVERIQAQKQQENSQGAAMMLGILGTILKNR